MGPGRQPYQGTAARTGAQETRAHRPARGPAAHTSQAVSGSLAWANALATSRSAWVKP